MSRSLLLTNNAVWTPAKLSNVLLWAESWDSGNTESGGRITVLKDKSLAGRNMTPQTTGPQSVVDNLLGGRKTASYGGTAGEFLKITGTMARPKTWIIVLASTEYLPNYAALSFGTAYPYVSYSSSAQGRVGFWPTGSTEIFTTGQVLLEGNYKVMIARDDLADPSLRTIDSDLSTVVETKTAHDVGARAASPSAFSESDFPGGGFPSKGRIAFRLVMSEVLSPSDEVKLLAYLRSKLYAQRQPPMPFIGTLTTQSKAQPGPYPIHHEGESGNTIESWGNRLVGLWSDQNPAHFVIGGTGDPGVGNRGSIETLVNQGHTNLVWIVNIFGNDSGSAISISRLQLALQRGIAIAQNLGATIKIVMCTEPLFGATYVTNNGFLTTANAALPAMVTTLTGLGHSIVLADCAAVFNTVTMLQDDEIHCNELGNDSMSSVIVAALVAAGWAIPTVQIICSGHSRVSGGDNMIRATAGWRNILARDLAAL